MTKSELKDSLLTLPNFICLGAQKAGTTTLYDILKQHPQIFLPDKKETKFFQYEDEYEKGANYYSQYFKDSKDEKSIGEIDPSYIFFAEKTAPRIKEILGEKTKFIVILRNPVDRAYSHYLMSVRRNVEQLSFKEALLAEKSRTENGSRDDLINYSYIQRGFYAQQLKKYFEYFAKENFLVLVFEKDFVQNPSVTLKRVFDFLGVGNMGIDTSIKSNRARKLKSKMFADLIQKGTALKKMAKFLVPVKSWRKSVRKTITGLNEKNFTPDKLAQDFREKIFHDYFESEISSLEKLATIDLSLWKP